MTPEDRSTISFRMSGLTREEFETFWAQIDASAVSSKDSPMATIRLTSFYRNLGDEDRTVVDDALADWVIDGDERRRFDAVALIQEFEIRSALGAMRERLAALPEGSDGSVGAERAKLERVVAALS
jgi:hypothetical protein